MGPAGQFSNTIFPPFAIASSMERGNFRAAGFQGVVKGAFWCPGAKVEGPDLEGLALEYSRCVCTIACHKASIVWGTSAGSGSSSLMAATCVANILVKDSIQRGLPGRREKCLIADSDRGSNGSTGGSWGTSRRSSRSFIFCRRRSIWESVCGSCFDSEDQVGMPSGKVRDKLAYKPKAAGRRRQSSAESRRRQRPSPLGRKRSSCRAKK